MSAFSRMVVAVAESTPVRSTFTNTRAGKALVRRFVAGDTLAEAIGAAQKLNRQGMKVSLDLLGEEVNSAVEVEAALASYVACLDEIAANSIDGNVSIKLTQLGLAFDPDLARATLDRLAASAARLGLTVTIDMEDSTYTEETVDIYADAQPRHGNLGLALQAYLYRTPDDLLRLMPLGGHLRLCKGAYVEPEAVAFQSTSEVDAAFARLLNVLMGFENVTPAVATHDPQLIDLARQLDHQRRLPFEFQMLYGVRPQAQKELAAAGYPIRIYVPYGSRWYPYLVRRLAERPANLGFFLRALVGR
ncbi:MAG TPA: proline dehydrogenase family protein [Acidimicrobiia bacterium]|nr:proline dehydrogenase family protein [Acidimicrobiia bacterium]